MALLLALGASASSPVCAQESDEEAARNHFQAARSYFDQARYVDAEREFEESFRLSGRAVLLLNIATSCERRDDLPAAVAALRRYLEAAPEAEDRVTIQTRIDSLSARIESDSEPEPEPDPERSTDAPPEAPPPATGGDDTVAIIGWSTLGLGAALAIVSLATGLVANSIYEDLQTSCTGGVCPESRRGDVDTHSSLAVTSTVTMFVAAGVGIAGALLLILPPVLGGSSDTARLRLAPGPGDVGVALSAEL